MGRKSSHQRKLDKVTKANNKKLELEWNTAINTLRFRLRVPTATILEIAKLIDIRFNGDAQGAKFLILTFYRNGMTTTSWESCRKLLDEQNTIDDRIAEIQSKRRRNSQGKPVKTSPPSQRTHYGNLTEEFISSPEFLQDYRWKQLRLEALSQQRQRLGFNKCECCNDRESKLNVDHIKPRKTHPELALNINNLQILCDDCNEGKGNWCDTDFRT